VGFLYIECHSESSGFLVTKTSGNGSSPFVSISIANLIFGCMLLKF
jgi:hypothetical protein